MKNSKTMYIFKCHIFSKFAQSQYTHYDCKILLVSAKHGRIGKVTMVGGLTQSSHEQNNKCHQKIDKPLRSTKIINKVHSKSISVA